jgi:hypothetical protein
VYCHARPPTAPPLFRFMISGIWVFGRATSAGRFRHPTEVPVAYRLGRRACGRVALYNPLRGATLGGILRDRQPRYGGRGTRISRGLGDIPGWARETPVGSLRARNLPGTLGSLMPSSQTTASGRRYNRRARVKVSGYATLRTLTR